MGTHSRRMRHLRSVSNDELTEELWRRKEWLGKGLAPGTGLGCKEKKDQAKDWSFLMGGVC